LLALFDHSSWPLAHSERTYALSGLLHIDQSQHREQAIGILG
jgi:hypothetical protein